MEGGAQTFSEGRFSGASRSKAAISSDSQARSRIETSPTNHAGSAHRNDQPVRSIKGKRTVSIGVLPTSDSSSSVAPSHMREAGPSIPIKGRIRSFAPKRLLDIESGKSILITSQKFLDENRFQEVDKNGALVVSTKETAPPMALHKHGVSLEDRANPVDMRNFDTYNEVGFLGGAWRGALRRLMLATFDSVNGLRLSRQMQLSLPFLTAYEAYVIGQIIESLGDGHNSKSDVSSVLRIAFRNRNVSRVIVQNIGARWDFLWHWYSQVTSNRLYDAWGQFPVVGITSFPATENFPATRNYALASIFRVVLGEGSWITRVVTGGHEGIITNNPKTFSQNLAAESNGFEVANRNQLGTFFGRQNTNQFRLNHRLPTDESIVRTFVSQPMPTLINNGVVHTLRQLSKHWHNMLTQFSGNFAHQRMEQLDPFETMRFHMPVVCVVLSSLRGRNKWDSDVLGPFMRKCQELKPSSTSDACQCLVRDMQKSIVTNLCAGIASVIDPLRAWLEAIVEACERIEKEAQDVYKMVSSVDSGIRLGHDLMAQVSWRIPSESVLKNAILDYIRGDSPCSMVNERRIRSAMLLTTPRDKRTLIELVRNGLEKTKPARQLLGRVKTLLQRELRRENLNVAIQELSMGDYIKDVVHNESYWIEEDGQNGVYIYDEKVTGRDLHRLVHVESGAERFVSLSTPDIRVRSYVPVAEAISRAQRAFMNIELDHGKKFKYNAFMEFSFLRTALRRLVVISQLSCEQLDNARLNILRAVQRSNLTQVSIHDLEVGKEYYAYNSTKKVYDKFTCNKALTPTDPEWSKFAQKKIVLVPPQSIVIIGGGPTGLMTTIHCTESVLMSGGVVKLYEARDSFAKGGATFERAQIVRLDARWIAMLRYHLGTGFEDVFIPASGETDSQLGNTLPTQAFVEITIKDLENMLHVEVSKLWSKGVIQCYTDSRAQYDHVTNSLTKTGQTLKLNDKILRKVDPEGNPTDDYFSWKVKGLVYQEALSLNDLRVGQEYGVYVRLQNSVCPFRLTGVDLDSRTYTFKSLKTDTADLKATASNLPSVYPPGTTRHADVSKVVLECVQKSRGGGNTRDELPMKLIRKKKFTLDIGHTHVIECIGKPHGSKVHFCATTSEFYGVSCFEGLKVSMGMHNFGEKRWGQGLLDDIRSVNDQNTRIIGDFTKMVRQAPIADLMYELMKGKNWQAHFEYICADSKYPTLDQDCGGIVNRLLDACKWHSENAPSFKRQTLQTRFFETGDNFYLGMEFTREYDSWKKAICNDIVRPLQKCGEPMSGVGRMQGTLAHHIDRLWYEACLEVIRRGDVYNPGARHRVARLHTINSYFEERLGSLSLGESFRLSDRPEEKYEMIIKGRHVVVRNVEGIISRMSKNTLVRREGNLTRQPDGNAESRVSLATFPVAHYVNFRTLRLNDESKGYVFAFIGDEQATPHFMRYSGLTGACINAMLFNNFIKQAIHGDSFEERYRLYSKETNWSNSEVVTRGTGSCYGQDGFLRPGFSYVHAIDYLHSKVIEYMETKQDLNAILSRDWLIKFAAALIPRGLEMNDDFIGAYYTITQKHIFDKFLNEVTADESIKSDGLKDALTLRREEMSFRRADLAYDIYWMEFGSGLIGLDGSVRDKVFGFHIEIAKRLEQVLDQIVKFARMSYLYNERVSSEMFNQPKSVDSIVDDFSVEAQNFANSLTMGAAFSAGALAFTLVDEFTAQVISTLLGIINILISFGTMTNVARYKIRNEEARISFFDNKFSDVKKAVFGLLKRDVQESMETYRNPFTVELDIHVATFLDRAEYYGIEDPIEFKVEYDRLRMNIVEPERFLVFKKRLATYYIPDKYHENSYIQEFLVNIFKALDEMHFLLSQNINRAGGHEDANALFERLEAFTPSLESSLQRGPIYWGFLKKRAFKHWDFSVVFRYLYSLFCCARSKGKTPLSPIQTETLGVVRHAKKVSKFHNNLRREVLDLENLYWATNESDIGSLVFMSGLFVFLASIIFTISRIVTAAGGSSVVTDVAFWANVASSFGAILALFHLFRKLSFLFGLWFTLGRKARISKSTEGHESIVKVRRVTLTQILLTLTRILAAGAAAAALPWSVAVKGFEDSISLDQDIPFWIALAAVVAAVFATIFFFIVEYVVRYHLSPKLGEFVCEAFREEIENIYTELEIPLNDIDTKQVQERQTWEYVAREFLHRYRFDTVFAADRFGAILQYIQSGMDSRL